uniref:Aminotransferase-like plant mobile domain-containing protein n=1 Tax=Ananas comosus var. bracteatus TaxID=296719 RepID=A0A6V7Q2L9_ANACO|nr:unnamed protein product [Ananas comosus var. bracteatus]
MALLHPLPSLPSPNYTLLRQYVKTDPSWFVSGPSFVDDPIPEDFLFRPLMANAIHFSSWYVSTTSKSFGKSLQTWPSVSDAYLTWLDCVEASYVGLQCEVRIYEAIQLSKTPPIAYNLLLAAALCFWSPVSNTFLFRGDPSLRLFLM